MKINYKIEEVRPNVFAVIVEDHYNRAMLFCRVQEFYESPNTKFRGKKFSIWDFIEWYSRQKKDVFTYAFDWGGFNIPFDVLEKCIEMHSISETPYDDIMYEIYYQIGKMKGDGKAYVIGVDSLESDTFEHEVAHGLYYTNKEYKQLMDEITETIEWQDYLKFEKNLLDMGYTAAVIPDEIQAYLTTNWEYPKFSKGVNKKLCKTFYKQYIQIFNRYENI